MRTECLITTPKMKFTRLLKKYIYIYIKKKKYLFGDNKGKKDFVFLFVLAEAL